MLQKIKRTSVLWLLALCVLLAPAALAQESTAGTRNHPARLVDEAGLLTAEEASALLMQLDEISERQQSDVVVVTVDSLEGKSAMAYADDYFDYNGYGMGSDQSGILFLISMREREWRLSTKGSAISAYTDAGQEYITDLVTPKLSERDYSGAFEKFASLCDRFLTQAAKGAPYDVRNMPREPVSTTQILIALVGGALLALVVVMVMRSSLRSVRPQPVADSYVRPGSLYISSSRDIYLYSTVSRTARQTSSSGSGGGGSSTHTSSSGSTHGGSGGRF